VPTCPSCGAENRIGARFCDTCGVTLAEQPASREQRKVVTVLFCDVTGSTALAERLDPESLRSLLAQYFEQMKAIVERHGGTVEKFIGDAVMAVFGVPSCTRTTPCGRFVPRRRCGTRSRRSACRAGSA
jgi:class 3 adenylate cyclase